MLSPLTPPFCIPTTHHTTHTPCQPCQPFNLQPGDHLARGWTPGKVERPTRVVRPMALALILNPEPLHFKPVHLASAERGVLLVPESLKSKCLRFEAFQHQLIWTGGNSK